MRKHKQHQQQQKKYNIIILNKKLLVIGLETAHIIVYIYGMNECMLGWFKEGKTL